MAPAEGGDLVGGGQVSPSDLAAEYQGDDGPGHVLVDAGEGDGLDVEAGLLADLAAQAVGDGLAGFQDAAGGFPVAVVAALDEQRPAVVVGDDAADADRVAGRLVVHEITSRVSGTQRARRRRTAS